MSNMAVASQTEVAWGNNPITLAQASEFAAKVTGARGDQDTIAQNLTRIPPAWMVRGVFFEGLARLIAQARSEQASTELFQRASLPHRTTSFKHYPLRDFYKLYYLATRLLHPTMPLGPSMCEVAKTFFPIFRSSTLGKTMNALMGDKPRTILPLLAKAYNLSAGGPTHEAELTGEREVTWRCTVEAVEWYVDTFTGIVAGAMPPGTESALRIEVAEKAASGAAVRYRFVIGF